MRDQGITEDDVNADIDELEALIAGEELGNAEIPNAKVKVPEKESEIKISSGSEKVLVEG